MKINSILEKLTGYRLIKGALLNDLNVQIGEFYSIRDIANWKSHSVTEELAGFVLQNWSDSYAQIQQDLLVLFALQEKVGGYFVEFGATDGKLRSNTFLLEDKFNWDGILAEPGLNWQQALSENRKVTTLNYCVSSDDDKIVDFFESTNPEYSTIAIYREMDYHIDARKNGKTYPVKTISLSTLLRENGAPNVIDYLSMDTEGSEYEILRVFPFNLYTFMIITVEHNYTTNRQKIFELLTANNYVRVLENVSAYDDWYVNPSLVDIGRLVRD